MRRNCPDCDAVVLDTVTPLGEPFLLDPEPADGVLVMDVSVIPPVSRPATPDDEGERYLAHRCPKRARTHFAIGSHVIAQSAYEAFRETEGGAPWRELSMMERRPWLDLAAQELADKVGEVKQSRGFRGLLRRLRRRK